MKLFTILFLTLTFSLVTVPSHADTILLPPGSNSLTVTPTGWNTGSHNATLTTPTGSTDITMVCVDIYRSGPALNQPYQAALSTFADISATRHPELGNSYRAAAWLYTQILDPANIGSVGAIQQAMWGLLTPYAGSNQWTVAALSAAPTFDTTNFVILTPIGGTQEMIARVSGNLSQVPEPATLTLLGAGLAALAGGLKKKRQKP